MTNNHISKPAKQPIRSKLNMLMLNKNLKKIIANRGITVTSLAKQTKVPLQTLHGWLGGNQPKSIVQVKAVCRFLNVSLDELCFDEKPEYYSPVEDNLDEINAGVFEVILRKVKD